jgi:uncharacterized protein (DUF2336 family)
MTAAPYSDGVLRLAQAADAQRASALLKAATELFVLQPDHTRTEIAVFEELAIQLLRATPLEDKVAVAELLARHPDSPTEVLSLLMADVPAVAAPVIAGAPQLPDVALLTIVASGSPDHLALLAARPRLSPALVEALLRKLPEDRLPILAANPTIRLSAAQKRTLLARATGHPALAAALAGRSGDVDDADLVGLYLDLDGRGRRRVTEALEIEALKAFAAGRPAVQAAAPDADAVAILARAVLSRDPGRIAPHLAAVTGVPEAIALRLVVDPGGEALAVALKAAGVDGATASRVLLFSGGAAVRDYFDVKRLVEVFETVSTRAASRLCAHWRGEEAAPARGRRHVPQAEDGAPVRTTAEARTRAKPARSTRARTNRNAG